MDHDLQLIIRILEILEIEVFIIPIILEILEIVVSIIPIWLKYWKFKSPLFPYGATGNTGGGRAAPGVRLRGAWFFLGPCSWNFVTCPISGNNTFP